MQALFDEEVELLVVDPDKLRALEATIEASYVLGDWIKLLGMYKHNQSWKKVDDTVREMDRRFVLREKFWITEIEEKVTRSQGKDQAKEVFELAERALKHGDFAELGRKCANYAVEMYAKGNITLTYAESKMEQLIQLFKDDVENGSFYFHKLRKLYGVKTFPDAINRTRRAYHRQLRLPFTSVDVDFSEYLRWEVDAEEAGKMRPVYDQTKRVTDEMLYYIQQRQYDKMPPSSVLNMLEEESPVNETAYFEWLSKVPADRRLVRLRRMSKSGRFSEKYLRELDLSCAEESEVNAEYNRVINQNDGRVKSNA